MAIHNAGNTLRGSFYLIIQTFRSGIEQSLHSTHPQSAANEKYDDGNADSGERIGVFQKRKRGMRLASTEAIGRLISLAFRYGVPPDKIVKQLRGIRCHVPLGFGPNQILSCPDAIGKALADKYHLASGNGSKAVGQLEMPIAYAQGACPECGGAIEHEGGCMVCRACGYSKCA